MAEQKRILITGASGFIGSHLVRHSLELGYEVTVAIRPETKSRSSNSNIRTIVLDYSDNEAMQRVFESERRPDGAKPWHYIIHNAGLTKTPNLDDFYEANAENTRRLVEAIAEAGVEPERFLYMSSLSSYSDKGSADGTLRISDEQIPTTVYGHSKLIAESYVRDSGLNYTMLLPTGVYGSGEQDYMLAIKSIEGGINFMAGCSEQELTFVHGYDVARASLMLLADGRASGNSYIITDGDVYTDKDFGLLVRELLGTKRLFNLRAPLWLLWIICELGGVYSRLTGKSTPLNPDKYPLMRQRSWRCDVSPLFDLGFRPRYKLREGLEEMIAWGRSEGILKP